MITQVRGIRKKLGITQAKLAEAIKVPEPTVRSWESGRRNISVEFAKRIVQYANWSGVPTTLDEFYSTSQKGDASKKPAKRGK